MVDQKKKGILSDVKSTDLSTNIKKKFEKN